MTRPLLCALFGSDIAINVSRFLPSKSINGACVRACVRARPRTDGRPPTNQQTNTHPPALQPTDRDRPTDRPISFYLSIYQYRYRQTAVCDVLARARASESRPTHPVVSDGFLLQGDRSIVWNSVWIQRRVRALHGSME